VPSTSPPPGGAPPSGNVATLLWPFNIRETGGVSIAVSPPIIGPAIVEEIEAQFNLTGGATFPTFALYAGDDDGGAGSNLAASVVPSGDELFERTTNQIDDVQTSIDNKGLPISTVATGTGLQRLLIKKIVRKSRFFLKIRISANATNQLAANGYVRVYQAVPESILANFR